MPGRTPIPIPIPTRPNHTNKQPPSPVHRSRRPAEGRNPPRRQTAKELDAGPMNGPHKQNHNPRWENIPDRIPPPTRPNHTNTQTPSRVQLHGRRPAEGCLPPCPPRRPTTTRTTGIPIGKIPTSKSNTYPQIAPASIQSTGRPHPTTAHRHRRRGHNKFRRRSDRQVPAGGRKQKSSTIRTGLKG